jgi:DNA-binding CsgD family transcriptional regulator
MTLSEIVETALADAAQAVAAWSGVADTAVLPAPDLRQKWTTLTAREQEVAALLANQATDKEIAEQLSISPRTVSTHVASILRKLGLHTRRSLAAYTDPDESNRDG